MKKFVNQVLDPKWFALCYLPFLAVNMVQLINPMTVTRVFLVFFALWGVAVAAKCYFTGKQIYLHMINARNFTCNFFHSGRACCTSHTSHIKFQLHRITPFHKLRLCLHPFTYVLYFNNRILKKQVCTI